MLWAEPLWGASRLNKANPRPACSPVPEWTRRSLSSAVVTWLLPASASLPEGWNHGPEPPRGRGGGRAPSLASRWAAGGPHVPTCQRERGPSTPRWLFSPNSLTKYSEMEGTQKPSDSVTRRIKNPRMLWDVYPQSHSSATFLCPCLLLVLRFSTLLLGLLDGSGAGSQDPHFRQQVPAPRRKHPRLEKKCNPRPGGCFLNMPRAEKSQPG